MTYRFDQSRYMEELLRLIRGSGNVIPVIGPELVTIEDGGRQVPLNEYIAHRLVAQYGITDALPEPLRLSDVVVAYTELDRRNVPDTVYSDIFAFFKDNPHVATPPALQKLGAIREFRLLVSTTFDSLLVRALNEARFGGAPRTVEVVFNTGSKADLPQGWENGANPFVYNLCGRASPAPNYVVTDEDTLDLMYELASPTTAPRLFEELGRSHLLVLGCGFPGWLSKFFLRVAKRKRLSERGVSAVIADRVNASDVDLAQFFGHYAYRIDVFPGSALEFVDQLHGRWLAESQEAASSVAAAPVADAGGVAIPEDAIFISYAREDLPYAERIFEGIRTDLDVWMDRTLEPGDDYGRVIAARISRCTLFMPVISRNCVGKPRRYLYREWAEAVEASKDRVPGAPFIIPVIIDDSPDGMAGIEVKFWERHAIRLPGGVVTPEFSAQLREAVRRARGAEAVYV
ncbi:MAG TPA: toll/interleukin-1 receptor domain-containing protein [Longimicrobiales bacterium]|nr:toll/interleukin-1 receptor domain-containing protein [Longimicrobiales bacterium]